MKLTMLRLNIGIIAANYVLLFYLILFSGQLNSSIIYGLILLSFPHFMWTYIVWFKRVNLWREEWWALAYPFLYSVIFYLSLERSLGPILPFHLIKIIYVYLVYHFCGQLYGVSRWICGELSVSLNNVSKWAYRSYFYVLGIFSLIHLEFNGSLRTLFYTDVPLVSVPGEVWKSFYFFSLAITFLMVLWATFRALKLRDMRQLSLLMIPSISFLWFMPPSAEILIPYLPILHGLQYLPFVLMKLKKESSASKLALFLGSVGMGFILFRVTPFWSKGISYQGTLWSAFVLTLLNSHHFVIDGRIWKLSDPRNSDLTSCQESQFQEGRDPA